VTPGPKAEEEEEEEEEECDADLKRSIWPSIRLLLLGFDREARGERLVGTEVGCGHVAPERQGRLGFNSGSTTSKTGMCPRAWTRTRSTLQTHPFPPLLELALKYVTETMSMLLSHRKDVHAIGPG
jgi:hypothetical protein